MASQEVGSYGDEVSQPLTGLNLNLNVPAESDSTQTDQEDTREQAAFENHTKLSGQSSGASDVKELAPVRISASPVEKKKEKKKKKPKNRSQLSKGLVSVACPVSGWL